MYETKLYPASEQDVTAIQVVSEENVSTTIRIEATTDGKTWNSVYPAEPTVESSGDGLSEGASSGSVSVTSKTIWPILKSVGLGVEYVLVIYWKEDTLVKLHFDMLNMFSLIYHSTNNDMTF